MKTSKSITTPGNLSKISYKESAKHEPLQWQNSVHPTWPWNCPWDVICRHGYKDVIYKYTSLVHEGRGNTEHVKWRQGTSKSHTDLNFYKQKLPYLRFKNTPFEVHSRLDATEEKISELDKMRWKILNMKHKDKMTEKQPEHLWVIGQLQMARMCIIWGTEREKLWGVAGWLETLFEAIKNTIFHTG